MGAGAHPGQQSGSVPASSNNNNNNNNPSGSRSRERVAPSPANTDMFSNVPSRRSSRNTVKTTLLSPCQRCYTALSKLKRKKECTECTGQFCDSCLTAECVCRICTILLSANKALMSQVKVRDLKRYLKAKCVVTESCREKSELIDLCVKYLNSLRPISSYYDDQQQSGRGGVGGGGMGRVNSRNFSSYYYDSPNNIQQQPQPMDTSSNAAAGATASDEQQNVPPQPPAPAGTSSNSNRNQQTVYHTVSSSGTVPAPSSSDDTSQRGDDVLTPVETPRSTSQPAASAATAQPHNPNPNRNQQGNDVTMRDNQVEGWEGEEEEEDDVMIIPPPPAAAAASQGAAGVGQQGRRASISDIHQPADIDRLTIRQCKEILANNFVDYKGCCEKWELKQRVRRLYDEHLLNVAAAAAHYEDTDEDGVEVGTGVTGPGDIPAPPPAPVLEGGSGTTAGTSTGTAGTSTGTAGTSTGTAGTSTGTSAVHRDRDLCKICMDAAVDCVLLECGHMLTCTRCGKRLAECPVCRQYVVRVVHTFKA